MALNEKKNPEYEKWLETANFREAMSAGPSACIFKKDGTAAWTDETGKSFPALSNQKIWEAGYGFAVFNHAVCFNKKQLLSLYEFLRDNEDRREAYDIEDIYETLEKLYFDMNAEVACEKEDSKSM